MDKKLLLIDGNSLFFKSFYATYIRLKQGSERGKNGEPVNGVRSFAHMITNLRSKFEDHHILVAFDEAGGHTHRHQHDFYKANRKEAPQELYEQIPMVREFLDLYGISWVSKKELEADDIIGILSKRHSMEYETTIITSDKDLLQLVDQNVRVLISIKGVSLMEEYNNFNFEEKYFGLRPEQVYELKGIMGDSSDNLQGIRGIGPKGAVKLIDKYNTVERVIKNAENESPGIRDKIIKDQDHAILCRDLAKILTSSEQEFDIESTKPKPYDKEVLTKWLEEKNLLNVIRKI